MLVVYKRMDKEKIMLVLCHGVSLGCLVVQCWVLFAFMLVFFTFLIHLVYWCFTSQVCNSGVQLVLVFFTIVIHLVRWCFTNQVWNRMVLCVYCSRCILSLVFTLSSSVSSATVTSVQLVLNQV